MHGERLKLMRVSGEIYDMFEPDHIFHARERAKLNQNPVCQDRAEDGSKNGPRSDLRAQI